MKKIENKIIDIFDEDYNYIGTDSEENVHNNELYHQNLHCWIISQRRKRVIVVLWSNKDVLKPNKYDIAIYGQMSAGEKVIEGVKHIEDFLGLEINRKKLEKIGITKEIAFMPTKDKFHKVFSHSYFLKEEKIAEKYIKDFKNVDGIFEMSIKDALDLFSNKVESIFIDLISKEDKKIRKEVCYNDFVPRGRAYLHKILFAINYFLEEEEWEKKYKEHYKTF